MNKYELTIIVRPDLEKEALTAEFDQVKELITKFGGTIDKVDEWGKRKLAYEINKVNEGFYNFIEFTADANVPAEIESRIRSKENILRYLIIRQED